MKKTTKTTKKVKMTDLDKANASEVKGGVIAGTECKCGCSVQQSFGEHDSQEMSKGKMVGLTPFK